jgi:Mrp family chromosome partitioning ATPase/capsular polysaccharide biosynthesis protein
MCSVAVIGFSTLENKFTATTLVLLDQGTSRMFTGTTPESRSLPPLNPDAEVEILKSENVALRALEKLGPTLPPEFSPEPGKLSIAISGISQSLSEIGSWVMGPWIGDSNQVPSSSLSPGGGAAGSMLPDPLPRTTAVGLRVLRESVQIRRRALTDIIAVEATFTNPVLAAYVANAYATSYFDEQRSAKLKALEQVETVLKARLSELDDELKRSAQQLGLRQDYQDTQSRLHDIEKQRDAVSADARMVSVARPPRNPDFPGAVLLGTVGVVVSTAVSFAFAMGFAYLGEARSRRIRTEDELERLTGVDNLAAVPLMKWRHGKSGAIPSKDPPGQAMSRYVESIRSLYYNLALATGGSSRLGAVMVTSTESDEGKTTLALSLGRVSASSGARVLIVDCNVRHPKLHEVLDLENERGFVDLLAGPIDKQNVIQNDPESACRIITVGGSSQDSIEQAFRVEAVSEVVKSLQAEYDLVLLIAPPIKQSAEAMLLLSCTNYVLYVVAADRIASIDVQAAFRQIRRVIECNVFTAFNFMPYGD